MHFSHFCNIYRQTERLFSQGTAEIFIFFDFIFSFIHQKIHGFQSQVGNSTNRIKKIQQFQG